MITRIRAIDFHRPGHLAERADEVAQCAICCRRVRLGDAFSVGGGEASWWIVCGDHTETPAEQWDKAELRMLTDGPCQE
ncbi:MAG: hypothetical protein M3537_06445 [Chloroflexota bacterium]|nr:hypothetical protein [Chloroflexota bacterium]